MSESTKKTNGTSTSSLANEVCISIRDGNSNANGLLDEYFEAFAKSMGKFSHTDGIEEFEKTIQNITSFLPHRNEIINVFLYIARYLKDEESAPAVHKFFESILPYYDMRRLLLLEFSPVTENDPDNFKFLVHEMFLYAIAMFIKHEKFKSVAYLTETPYCYSTVSNGDLENTFMGIEQYARSVEIPDDRRGYSLRARLLVDRADVSVLNQMQIIQADFVLIIKSTALRMERPEFYHSKWCWETSNYAASHYPLEIFAKAQSKNYFDKIKIMWKIESRDDLLCIVKTIGEMGGVGYEYSNLLANVKNLCQTR